MVSAYIKAALSTLPEAVTTEVVRSLFTLLLKEIGVPHFPFLICLYSTQAAQLGVTAVTRKPHYHDLREEDFFHKQQVLSSASTSSF